MTRTFLQRSFAACCPQTRLQHTNTNIHRAPAPLLSHHIAARYFSPMFLCSMLPTDAIATQTHIHTNTPSPRPTGLSSYQNRLPPPHPHPPPTPPPPTHSHIQHCTRACAPRKYDVVIVRKRSCPAVSQIWSGGGEHGEAAKLSVKTGRGSCKATHPPT